MRRAVILGIMRMRGADRIAKALLDAADVDIIALEPTNGILAEAGIPHIDYQSLLTKDVAFRGQQQVVPRAEAIMRGIMDPAFRLAYPTFKETAWQEVVDQLSGFVQNNLIPTTTIIESFRHACTKWRVELLIVNEDALRDSRTLVETAKRFGVPSLQVQHGIPTGSLITHTGVHTTHVAAFSEASKAMFISLGAHAGRVFVTGNPGWDRYMGPPLPGHRDRLCAQAQLDPARPILMYAFTQSSAWTTCNAAFPRHHVDLSEAVWRSMMDVARRHPDWQFLLRPRQRPDEIARAKAMVQAAHESGVGRMMLDMLPVYESLMVSDVVLCTQSNIGIEALCLRTPVINVDIEEFGSAVYREGIGPLFNAEDAVVRAATEADIAPLMERCVSDRAFVSDIMSRREATLTRFNGPLDGRAAGRVAALAVDVMRSGAHQIAALSRYPEIEPALARSVPKDVAVVVLAGRSAQAMARALALYRPEIQTLNMSDTGDVLVDCIVYCDPVSPYGEGQRQLARLRAALTDQGRVVAWFRTGDVDEARQVYASRSWQAHDHGYDRLTSLGDYTLDGVEGALGRCDFTPVDITPYGWFDGALPDAPTCMGWIVLAQAGWTSASEFAKEQARRAHRAAMRNRTGEAQFQQGNLEEAQLAFEQASLLHEDALYFNNLGVALHAMGRLQPAWDAFQSALHIDPSHEEARTNLTQVADAMGRQQEAERMLALFPIDRDHLIGE